MQTTKRKESKGKSKKKGGLQPLTEAPWENGAPKTGQFELYKIWRMLPTLFLGLPEQIVEKLGLGSDEEDLIPQLVKVKSKSDFARTFKVSRVTLLEWDQKINASEEAAMTKKFFQTLTKNVNAALYRKILTEGDAPRVKMWHQIVEDWLEQVGMKHGGVIEYQLSTEERAQLEGLIGKNKKR